MSKHVKRYYYDMSGRDYSIWDRESGNPGPIGRIQERDVVEFVVKALNDASVH